MGYRIYQLRKPQHRHLVDVRSVDSLPPHQRMGDVLVLTPAELISSKVQNMVGRPKTANGLIDEADLRRLLLAFPQLKTTDGTVAERLRASQATESVLAVWKDLVFQKILPEDEQSEF